MKKVVIPIGLLLSAVVIIALLILFHEPPTAKPVAHIPAVVDTIEVTPRSLHYSVAAQGTLQAKDQTALVNEVSGRVVDIADTFKVGAFVNKGQWLIRLEDVDYQTALSAAKADVASARSALEEERALGVVAERDWRDVNPGKVPALGLRKPQLEKALADLDYARARLRQAQRNLQRTTIVAPYDGLLDAADVNVGQYLTVGTPLGNVLGTATAELRLPVTADDLRYLFAQPVMGDLKQADRLPVELTLDDQGDQRWHAHLVRVEGIVDERSRFVRVVAELDDPYGRTHSSQPLPFGRFVAAHIQGQQIDDVIKLPRHVLHNGQQLAVVDGQKIVRLRQVELLRVDQQSIYVGQGLQPGDRIIVSPVSRDMIGEPARTADEQDTTTNAKGNGATQS